MVRVLDHVTTCRAIHERLLEVNDDHDSKDPTLVWLGLYELEAKLLLGHSDVGHVVHKVSALPSVEPKTLETMAALCIRAPSSGRWYRCVQ